MRQHYITYTACTSFNEFFGHRLVVRGPRAGTQRRESKSICFSTRPRIVTARQPNTSLAFTRLHELNHTYVICRLDVRDGRCLLRVCAKSHKGHANRHSSGREYHATSVFVTPPHLFPCPLLSLWRVSPFVLPGLLVVIIPGGTTARTKRRHTFTCSE